MSAFVRLVTRMRAYVLLQMRQLSKLPLADLTTVRLNAKMDASVLRQI